LTTFAAAGNSAGKPSDPLSIITNQTPQRNGGSDTSLIVVGGANWRGGRSSYSNYLPGEGGILSIYGFGGLTLCASTSGQGNYQVVRGTSAATAGVAAIGAYLLSKNSWRTLIDPGGPSTASNLKRAIQALGTQKKGAYVDSIPRAATDQEVSCIFDVGTGIVGKIPRLPKEVPNNDYGANDYYTVDYSRREAVIISEDEMRLVSNYPPSLPFD
jgi:hypothetical protein